MFWNKKEKVIDSVVITDDNFDELVTHNELPVFLDFWAPRCRPCQVLGPIVDELATEYKGKVVVGKINVDQNPGLGQHFKVKSIPTMMFVKNGQLIERMAGMVPKPNLQEMLTDLIALEIPDVVPSSDEEE